MIYNIDRCRSFFGNRNDLAHTLRTVLRELSWRRLHVVGRFSDSVRLLACWNLNRSQWGYFNWAALLGESHWACIRIIHHCSNWAWWDNRLGRFTLTSKSNLLGIRGWIPNFLGLNQSRLEFRSGHLLNSHRLHKSTAGDVHILFLNSQFGVVCEEIFVVGGSIRRCSFRHPIQWGCCIVASADLWVVKCRTERAWGDARHSIAWLQGVHSIGLYWLVTRIGSIGFITGRGITWNEECRLRSWHYCWRYSGGIINLRLGRSYLFNPNILCRSIFDEASWMNADGLTVGIGIANNDMRVETSHRRIVTDWLDALLRRVMVEAGFTWFIGQWFSCSLLSNSLAILLLIGLVIWNFHKILIELHLRNIAVVRAVS